jgi:curved DNA-binding protein CbpA
MPAPSTDPYETLGVSRRASDDELRAAYRRLVQVHHPDHNDGSPASARRFEEIQEAYAQVRERRERRGQRGPRGAEPKPRETADPDVEARLRDLERQLREAQAVRERAQRAADEAAAASYKRPSDEELGYVHTDDTFAKLLDDAQAELSGRLGQARKGPVGRRVKELIDELASKLAGGG